MHWTAADVGRRSGIDVERLARAPYGSDPIGDGVASGITRSPTVWTLCTSRVVEVRKTSSARANSVHT